MRRRHPGQPHPQPRHHARTPVSDDEIVILQCSCCQEAVRMLGLNVRRLFEAALSAYGPAACLNLGELPDADWTLPASDDMIAAAVAVAMHP